MIKVRFLIVLTFSVFALYSCKKQEDIPYTLDMRNTVWSDSANINSAPYKPFTVTFQSDGRALIQFLEYTPYEGTWNKPLFNDTVYFYFDESSNVKWMATGVLSEKNAVMKGTLSTTNSSSISGTFTIRRQ